MMKYNFWGIVPLCFIALSSISCGPKSRPAQTISSEVEVIEVPQLPDTAFLYSEVFSKVEYVPLELTEQSAVSSLGVQMAIVEDGGILWYNRPDGNLLRFSSDGRFLNRIGMRGRQAGEYSYLSDYAYNPYNNEVIIWDSMSQKLIFYDLEGEFLKTEDAPSWASGGSFRVFDKDHLVFYLSHSARLEISNSYVVTPIDDCETIVTSHTNDMQITMSPYSAFTGGNQLLCKPEYSSSVYDFNGNDLCHSFSISYSDVKKNQRPPTDQLVENPDVARCSDLFVSENYYVVSSVKDKKYYLSFIGKDDEEQTIAGIAAYNDMFLDKVIDDYVHWCTTGSIVPSCFSDDVCYFIQDSSPIPLEMQNEYLANADSQIIDAEQKNIVFEKLKEFFRMMDNDNPVILKCTLK